MEYKPVDELIELLAERGLAMRDRDAVLHHLRTVGHHRLTAFYKAFYITPKKFDATIPTLAEDIINLYAFDRRFRLLLLGPLEKVEVALRALIIKEIGDFKLAASGSPAAISLFDESLYDLKSEQERRNFDYARDGCKRGVWNNWISSFSRTDEGREIARTLADKSLSARVRQKAKVARQKVFDSYYESLPAWTILQSASFGPLANIFSALNQEIAVNIARNFRLPRRVLINIFYALKELRNSCAHHEPIWNWDATTRETRLQFPKAFVEAAGIIDENRNKIYADCAVIHILLSFLSRGHSTWYRRLKKLVNEFNTTYSSAMGFPDHWQTLPFWCVADIWTTATYEGLRARITQHNESKKKPS